MDFPFSPTYSATSQHDSLRMSPSLWFLRKPEVRPLVSLRSLFLWGAVFLLTVGAFLLTVKLLCLQSLKALFRCTIPL